MSENYGYGSEVYCCASYGQRVFNGKALLTLAAFTVGGEDAEMEILGEGGGKILGEGGEEIIGES